MRIAGEGSRATPSWSPPGATACRRRPTGSRCWRCSSRCANAATSCSSTPAVPGSRDASASGATPTGPAPPRAIWMRCATSSVRVTSSSTPQVTERASHSRTRLATAIACARSCWTAARARRSSPATAAPRRTGSARPSAPASPSSPDWRHGCARAPCACTGGSTTTCSRVPSCARMRARWRSCRPPPLPRWRETQRRWRASSLERRRSRRREARSGAGEQLPRRRAARRECRGGRRARSPHRPGCAHSASRPARAGHSPRLPTPSCLPVPR